MNTNERVRRIREVEKSVERLVDKGWNRECVTFQDESGEPFIAEIRLTIGGHPPEDSVI